MVFGLAGAAAGFAVGLWVLFGGDVVAEVRWRRRQRRHGGMIR